MRTRRISITAAFEEVDLCRGYLRSLILQETPNLNLFKSQRMQRSWTCKMSDFCDTATCGQTIKSSFVPGWSDNHCLYHFP